MATQFLSVTGEEITSFKQNSISQSAKAAKKFGVQIFQGRIKN